MNLKEGTRRLALLVGTLGGIAGSGGSYLELKSALQQKVLHDSFERLAASDDVKNERKCRLLGGPVLCSLDPNADIAAIAEPKDDFADIAQPAPTTERKSMRTDWNRLSRADQDKFLNSLNAKQQDKFAADMGWPVQMAPPLRAPIDEVTPLASELDGKEIKTINWGKGKDYTVESIETEDGNTLHATSPPSRWINLWVIMLPLAGFVIPWGLIRSVQWVAVGFLLKQE